jgi:hypothetical protein
MKIKFKQNIDEAIAGREARSYAERWGSDPPEGERSKEERSKDSERSKVADPPEKGTTLEPEPTTPKGLVPQELSPPKLNKDQIAKLQRDSRTFNSDLIKCQEDPNIISLLGML